MQEMAMTSISPRYILKIVVRIDGETKDTGQEFFVPTSQPPPLPGDDIQIPDDVAEKNGMKSPNLKIISRKFSLKPLPIGITGLIFLVCEPL